MVLLMGASLLMRSMMNAQRIDLGFNPSNVFVASMDLSMQGYDETSGTEFQARLLERLRAVAGVQRASLALTVPVTSAGHRAGMSIEGHEFEAGRRPQIDLNRVDPAFFATMEITLLQGRLFDERDTDGAPLVTIINQSMARRFWPDGDAIGKTISTGRHDDTFEIVGVVGDSKYRNLREQGRLHTYFPLAQNYAARLNIVARTVGHPLDTAPAIQAAIRELDAGLPIYSQRTLDDQVAGATSTEHAAATLFGAFGVLALVLAAAGLYGVMSYLAGRRVREIGIRMALGANRADVLGLIMRHGVVVIAIGVVVGIAGALIATQVLEQMLFGLSARDPLTLLGVALGMGAVAMAACYLPARRATRVDPMVALRHD
jgi:putative ABC transport system permease protein